MLHNTHDENQTPTPARPRGPKTRGSYTTKSRPAMISTQTEAKCKDISGEEEAPAANWWEPQARGRQRIDQRASPIPIPDHKMLDSGVGLGLPLHMRSYSPAPSTSALSDGPASPAALFLSAFSSPAPSVRSPSPLPSVISPAMAMFHSPPPPHTPAAPAVPPLVDQGTSVGGYVLGPVIGHGGFSTIRTGTSATTGGVVAVKIVPTKSSTPADAPRGRVGARAATIGRAATITVRGRTPAQDPESDDDGRAIAEEAALWSSLSHEHILPLFSAEETLGSWFLFTLYCPAGTLLDLLKRDGQIISPAPTTSNTPAKRRPSFASSFSPTGSTVSRGRSTSVTQPQPQRGGLLPETAATLFRQVVRGLRYLHEVARVVHRHIKLENVLVDENGAARISDFGLAVLMDDSREPSSSLERRSSVERSRRSVSRPRTFSTHNPLGHGPAPTVGFGAFGRANSVSVTSTLSPTAKSNFPPGSMPYAAPELLKPGRVPSKSRERGRPAPGSPDLPNPAQDVWALGCVLHALFTGRLPFTDAFEPRLQMKIVRGIWDEGVVTALPNSAALLETLRACLTVPVSQRWTIAEVDEYAWAVGVVDEQAEREAMRAQRGRTEAEDVFGPGRGRRGLSVVRDREQEERERSVSAVRGRRGAMSSGIASSYSPSPSANSGRGRRGVSVSRRRDPSEQPANRSSVTRESPSVREGGSVTREGRGASVTRDGRGPSLSREPSSPSVRTSRLPSLSRQSSQGTTEYEGVKPVMTRGPSLIPRPSSNRPTPLGSGSATPKPITNELAPEAERPLLHSARSFGSITSAVPPLSPGSDTRSSSQDRVSRSPSVDRRITEPPKVDVDLLGANNSPPSAGPLTPEEYVANRSRSRGRFATDLAIVDEGDPTWVKGYREPERI